MKFPANILNSSFLITNSFILKISLLISEIPPIRKNSPAGSLVNKEIRLLR